MRNASIQNWFILKPPEKYLDFVVQFDAPFFVPWPNTSALRIFERNHCPIVHESSLIISQAPWEGSQRHLHMEKEHVLRGQKIVAHMSMWSDINKQYNVTVRPEESTQSSIDVSCQTGQSSFILGQNLNSIFNPPRNIIRLRDIGQTCSMYLFRRESILSSYEIFLSSDLYLDSIGVSNLISLPSNIL